MPKHEIYFAGSISGGRQDAELYIKLIEYLRKYGVVLTEHIGDKRLSAFGETALTNDFIHDRDMEWLGKANRLVAEVTTASLGVGYELGRIVERNLWVSEGERKLILCLYRPTVDKRLSAMVSGCAGITMREYNTYEECLRHIDEFFAE